MEQTEHTEQTNKPDRVKLQKLWKKWFRRDNLIVMVLVGILLFIIALPTKKAQQEQTADDRYEESFFTTEWTSEKTSEGALEKGSVDSNQTGAQVNKTAETDYEQIQEEKLKVLLSAMDGVGEVEVMLTFVSSEEQVVEKEEPVKRSSSVEKDSEGGTRTVSEYEKGDTTVYQTEGGNPFVVKTLYPRVEGVLVVAEGAGDGTVNRSITEAVCALFGVEVHRVKVLPMGNKHISETGLIQ